MRVVYKTYNGMYTFRIIICKILYIITSRYKCYIEFLLL